MNEIVKICSKHGELSINLVLTERNNYYRCKLCRYESIKNYRLNNPEKVKEVFNRYIKSEKCKENKKNWRKNNKNRLKEINKKYRLKHKEKVALLSLNGRRKMIKELSNCYIKGLITSKSNLKMKEIPIELVECWRELIKIKRKLKEMKDEKK